jgi:hypothetical protein
MVARPQATSRWTWVFGIPLAFGLVEALRRAWVCDDIFISLRYIQNLFQGDGLVFNAGERVEGYTHFLWVMILATLHRFGADLVWLAKYLSIGAFALILITLWKRTTRRAGTSWGVPIAAVVLSLHMDMQIHASGGLETMPFTLVLLWGVLCTARRRHRWDLAAAVYAIATLLRPEGALYTAAAGLFILWRSRSWRPVLRFGALWLILVVPSEVFRLAYFGDPLPNTFYAKSGAGANWSQGWLYTSLYFRIYAVLLLGVVAMVVVTLRSRFGRRAAPDSPGTANMDVALLASMHVVLNLLYVTRLGGGFMFARFLIPMTPLLMLILEDASASFRRRSVEWGVLIVMVAGILVARVVHQEMLPGRDRVHGIVNEANYYPEDYLDTLRRQGEVLGRTLRGTDAGVGLLSGQDAMAYFGNLPYALEPNGLTDRLLARKPIAERGRPGHERTATLEDLLLRRVQFRIRYSFTVGLSMERQIRFEDLFGEIVYYDRDIMRQIQGRPGVNFLQYPQVLRESLPSLEGSPQQLAEDYRQAQLFYFIHNDDADLLAAYRNALLQRGIPQTVLEDIDRKANDFAVRMRIENLRPRPGP